jgi:hypothetical protein
MNAVIDQRKLRLKEIIISLGQSAEKKVSLEASELVMVTVFRAVPGSVGRCVRPGFNRQKIPVEISLMGQI